jgi:hypothetical protein
MWLITQIDRGRPGQGRLYAGVGLVAAAAGLTRPLLLLLGPIYGLYLLRGWWAQRRSPGEMVTKLGLFLIAFSLPVLLWCGFNKVTVDYFGPTTLTGYNLTQHSGGFIELAPADYADLSAIYLRHRVELIAATGSHSMTIWQAIPDMQAATGQSYSRLSRTLAAMSVALFARHPGLYLQSVFAAWLKFWDRVIYWLPLQVEPAGVRSLLGTAWWLQDKLWLMIYLGYGAVVCGQLLALLRRSPIPPFDLLLPAIVLLTSVAQALLEFGENGRYAIPFQPLILYTVLVQIESWLARRQTAA